jgi:PAS domain S-box-containing protein
MSAESKSDRMPATAPAGDATPPSQALLEAVLNVALDGIVTITEDGTVATFNGAAERIFGYQASEVIGGNVSLLMPEPYRSEHDGYIANYLRTGKARAIGVGRVVLGRRKDSSTFPLDVCVAELWHGGRRYFTGTVRDITGRWQTEEALRASQDRLDMVLEAGRMGSWVWDCQTNRSYWNRQEYELLGLPPGDGREDTELFFRHVHPEDLPRLRQALAGVLERGEAFEQEFRVVRADGAVRWLAGRGRLVRDPATGRPLQMFGVNYDITTQKEAETELLRHHRLLETISRVQSEFLAHADPQNVFGRMLETLLQVTDSAYGFIGEVLHRSDGHPYLKTYAISNIAWDDATRDFYERAAPAVAVHTQA